MLQRSPAATSKLSDIDAAFTVLAPSNDAFASAAGLSDALGEKGGPYKVLSRRHRTLLVSPAISLAPCPPAQARCVTLCTVCIHVEVVVAATLRIFYLG